MAPSSVVVRVAGTLILEALDEAPEWRFALRAMSVETRIGKRLAVIREHRRISQAELAAALGASKAAMGIMSTAESD